MSFFRADSIDTRSVVDSLRDLVSRSNVYIDATRGKQPGPNRQLLKNVATYITKIFDTLGLIVKPDEVGFPAGGDQAGNVSDPNFIFFNLSHFWCVSGDWCEISLSCQKMLCFKILRWSSSENGKIKCVLEDNF